MIKKDLPVIGITMGDPSGIGPEIILKSFLNPEIKKCRIIVIGDFAVMLLAYTILEIVSYKLIKVTNVSGCLFNDQTLNILDIHLIDINKLQPGKIQAASGNAAFKCIKKAVELAFNNDISAIVTAPLNKEALQLSGYKYPGHTEILASLVDVKDYAMLLYDKKLSVVHVSTHVSLLEAITGLSRERIEIVIGLANDTIKCLSGNSPRIAVAGINPHAGENGLFGNEEINEIIPAVKNMKDRGINVEGPVSPDTVFLKAVEGKYDLVVAMYHDQGHIPIKLLGFHSGVNITLGLPIIRTSVDHGTAFEIAWQRKAREDSMVEAIKLAVKLVQ
jgi:4-phospho-D-threonate 3-dehydrogenase / 4-phospho-D-erythronate 3-dehydrogenase